MSGNPPKLDLKTLVERAQRMAAGALDAGRADLAAVAYTRTANHIRALSRQPQYRAEQLHLGEIAATLDNYAAMAIMPARDETFDDFPIVEGWQDDPPPSEGGDGLPTEFDGVVADLGAAQFLPDGTPATELAQAAQFEHFQAERRRAVQRPVQIAPESAERGLLSNTILVQYGGSTTSSGSYVGNGGVAGPVASVQEGQVIRWDGNDNGEALPCRVAISRISGGANANFPSAGFSYRPFFHALWGSGERGQLNEAFGDVGRGVQFTVNASHVNITVGMDVPVAGQTPGAMYLNGSLAFFAGGSQAPVQRTVYVDALNTNTTFTVPLFATSLLPPQTTVFTGTYTLDFQDVSGNTKYTLGPLAGGGIVYPIPIGQDIYQIKVTTNSGGPISYEFIFQISL